MGSIPKFSIMPYSMLGLNAKGSLVVVDDDVDGGVDSYKSKFKDTRLQARE